MAQALAHQLSDQSQTAKIAAKMRDQEWRINNLYYVKNKQGKKVLFKMNWAQRLLFNGMWYLNIVLKARQLGMSTFIQIFMLDSCLFNKNMRTLVIAHGQKEAKEMFDDKIKYAYDNIEDKWQIKQSVVADTKNANELKFNNGSRISVGTSGRSGTFQIVHVSEFGKIAKKYPERAREIVTGTFEAVAPGQMIFIESTAEGREGRFYDMCQVSKKLSDAKSMLTTLDYKFWFLPWWKHPDNILDPTHVILFPPVKKYLEELELKIKIKLTRGQKAWYAKKLAVHGEDMKRENPSTAEEAFEYAIEGAYWGKQITEMRIKKRIGKVPHTVGINVDTWWDLGVNDTTAIWFTQTVGTAIHVIDYFENSGEGVGYYKDVLDEWHDEKGYRYGLHMWPHDGGKREFGNDAKTVQQSAAEKGLYVTINPRGDLQDGIEVTRDFFSICWIDEENCTKNIKLEDGRNVDVGINSLESFRHEWDEKLGSWKRTPLHDWASNGADAFRTLSTGHSVSRLIKSKQAVKPVTKQDAGGWT